MNRISLVGRLAKDTELRATQTGKSVLPFTLAVPRAYKKDTEVVVDFISCVAWQGTAEIINKYVKKGHKIAVSGRLETGEFEVDSKRHKKYYVVVEQFEFLEPKAKEAFEPEMKEDEKDTAPDASEVPF